MMRLLLSHIAICLTFLSSGLISYSQECSPLSEPFLKVADFLPCDYCGDSIKRFSYTPDSLGLNYTREEDDSSAVYHEQWLDLYSPYNLTDSVLPGNSPVFIFGHAENQGAEDLYEKALYFKENGVTFIAWESIQNSSEYADGSRVNFYDMSLYSRTDFQSVLDWLYVHHEEFGLDMERVFVGGASRGTSISFFGLDRENPRVKGIFMTQAFPDGQSIFGPMTSTQTCPIPFPKSAVTPNYPPLVLNYESTIGVTENGHDPLNGIEVLEEYSRVNPSTPVRMLYELGSNSFLPEEALVFINDPAQFFADNIPGVYDFNLEATPQSELLALYAPDSLRVQFNPADTTHSEFRFVWSDSNWRDSIFESYPSSVTCEMRMGRLSGCDDLSVADNLINYHELMTFPFSDSTSYSFPETGYLSQEFFHNVLDSISGENETDTIIGVQFRCNIRKNDNVSYFKVPKYWTAYSSMLKLNGDCVEITPLFFNVVIEDEALTIHSNLETTGAVILTLETLNGRTIKTFTTTAQVGLNRPYDCSPLVPGHYRISIIWNEGMDTVSFTK